MSSRDETTELESGDESTMLQITRYWEGVTLFGLLAANGFALQEVYTKPGFEFSTKGFALGLLAALLASWVGMYSAREAQEGMTRWHEGLYCLAHILGGVSIGAFGWTLLHVVGWI